MLKKIVPLLLISASFSSCLKGIDASEICTYDACSIKAPESEIQDIQTYLASNNLQAEKHCSGLFYSIEATGTGKTPGMCDFIAVNYVGKLINGTVFDRAPKSGSTAPAIFQLGGLIAGWKSAIPLIKEGGKIRLYIPPSLGYGKEDTKDRDQNVVVPANSILIFDIEFLEIK